ncbi:MAG: hypothetical protein PVF97_07660 [Desulfobacterales bacterium]
MSESKNFIDFMIEARNNPELYDGFLQARSVGELQALFGDTYAVSAADCQKLIDAKQELGIEEGGIPPAY